MADLELYNQIAASIIALRKNFTFLTAKTNDIHYFLNTETSHIINASIHSQMKKAGVPYHR
jgi:hypothetical protein